MIPNVKAYSFGTILFLIKENVICQLYDNLKIKKTFPLITLQRVGNLFPGSQEDTLTFSVPGAYKLYPTDP